MKIERCFLVCLPPQALFAKEWLEITHFFVSDNGAYKEVLEDSGSELQ